MRHKNGNILRLFYNGIGNKIDVGQIIEYMADASIFAFICVNLCVYAHDSECGAHMPSHVYGD